jgi:hypothetical protein
VLRNGGITAIASNTTNESHYLADSTDRTNITDCAVTDADSSRNAHSITDRRCWMRSEGLDV